jgi:hypothetical protein
MSIAYNLTFRYGMPLKEVEQSLLGHHQSRNYSELVNELLSPYGKHTIFHITI